MYKNFNGWSLENTGNGTVETKYLIEYINDERVWNKFLQIEDIDLYSKKEYNNIADALTFYLTWFVNEKCFDIKMWQQIFVNGEMVLEEFVEPKGCIRYYMRNSINREMENRMRSAEEKLCDIKKENSLYRGFMERMGKQFEELFEEYVKIEVNKNE